MQRARIFGVLLSVAILLAACGSDKKDAVSTDGSSTTVADPTAAPSSTTVGDSSSTTVNTAPIVTDVFPTISLPCQTVPVPVTPVTSPGQSGAVFLTKVQRVGDTCVDHVVFSLTSKARNTPGYSISYGTPPFTQDGSGAPVAVRGTAFITVRMEPAYGFDFENNRVTYAGPKRVTPEGANHVTEIVETGDFEGVLNWVIGLDAKRPFTVEATSDQLAVSVS